MRLASTQPAPCTPHVLLPDPPHGDADQLHADRVLVYNFVVLFSLLAGIRFVESWGAYGEGRSRAVPPSLIESFDAIAIWHSRSIFI